VLVSFVFAYFGFAALSLAKARHYQQVWPQRSATPQALYLLKTVGWFFIAVATVYLIQLKGLGLGFTDLFAVLSLAALALILQFSYAPRSVAAIGLVVRLRGQSAPVSTSTSHLQVDD